MSYLSPAYERIWGRPSPECYDRPRQESRQFIQKTSSELGKTNYAEAMRGNPTDHEYRMERQMDPVRLIRIRAFPCFF